MPPMCCPQGPRHSDCMEENRSGDMKFELGASLFSEDKAFVGQVKNPNS